MDNMMSIIDASRHMGKNDRYLYMLKYHFGWPKNVELQYIKHTKGAGKYFNKADYNKVLAFYANKKTPRDNPKILNCSREYAPLIIKDMPQHIRFD